MKHLLLILIVILATLTNAFIPNVIKNEESCGLGIKNTRKFCIACIAIGQMSAASQNCHMRMKIACLSLITNQCCSQTSNRFLYWKRLKLTLLWKIKFIQVKGTRMIGKILFLIFLIKNALTVSFLKLCTL